MIKSDPKIKNLKRTKIFFSNYYIFRKNEISFELKNFAKIYNLNRKIKEIYSPHYLFNKFYWCLEVQSSKNERGPYFLGIFLHCHSNKENFPVQANVKFTVINQKDPKENKSISELSFL